MGGEDPKSRWKDWSWTKGTYLLYRNGSTRVGVNGVQFVGIPVTENGTPTVWGGFVKAGGTGDMESRDLRKIQEGDYSNG